MQLFEAGPHGAEFVDADADDGSRVSADLAS